MKTLIALLVQLAAIGCSGAAFSAEKPGEKASKTESTLEKLLRVTGISAMPALRGEETSQTGSVWVSAIAEDLPVRWSASAGFRSPVFDLAGASVYAMQGDALVRLDGAGVAPVTVSKIAGIEKLVGFDNGAPAELVVLTTDRQMPLAVLSLTTGRLLSLQIDLTDAAQRRLLAQVRSQSRAIGTLRVLVEKQDRQDIARVVEWTDIVVQDASGAMRNLSQCKGANCSQPALSSDSKRVVFIKEER